MGIKDKINYTGVRRGISQAVPCSWDFETSLDAGLGLQAFNPCLKTGPLIDGYIKVCPRSNPGYQSISISTK